MPETVTPAAGSQTTTPPAPATPVEEKVTVSKAEFEKLSRDAARAAEAQSRATRLEKMVKQSNGHFKTQQPVTPPSQEEREAAAAIEDRKAERALVALAADPAYREVLDSDPTLRTILTQNPLAILPVYAPDALDAEDAVSLVKDALNQRVSQKAADKKAAEEASKPKPQTPPTPPAGVTNPQNGNDAEYEAAKKQGNTENALAAMISLKGKRMAGN